MKLGEVEKGTQTALVTGASSGIGKSYAEQLAAKGYNLIIVSRDEILLNSVAHNIAEEYGVKVNVLVKDLATQTAARELFEWTKEHNYEVSVLVNNAGMFSFCDILNTPEERIIRTILLHDVTDVLLCKFFAEDMAKRGGGHILNMSSFSIWMPFPGLSLYSSSKALLKNFSVSFSKEVQDKKVYVTAVCPAGIATDLYGLSKGLQKFGLKVGALSTPDFCARRGLNSMFKHRRCIVPDWWNRLFIPLCLLLPPFLLRILRNYTMKFQK